ncbi:hypothetical protein [Myroides odoratimimus]|uniref:hypothetical protein n=1 Tax=Myroides odoratimimus TaxID=76832 RepID=UPI002578D4FE|nr:hypothetical protein [Myroides odoratimimus]MDM1499542.1 hypothetical protein [Myroides odoratimimus]
MTIRNTDNIENDGHVKPLYIDKETGLVGTVAPSTPTAPITVLTASNSNMLPSNEANAAIFNQGDTEITVPITMADVAPNNLGIKIEDNSIVIQEDGTYQINAYLNMIISTTTPNKKITVEFPDVSTITGKPKTSTQTIEIPQYYRMIFIYAKLKQNNSHIAGARPILTNILNNQSDIITLPTVTLKLVKGDKLSLAFNRTMSSSGGVSSPAGDDVTKIGLGSNYGAKLYSLTITKL